MTSSTGQPLVCFKCKQPGIAPDLLPYYTEQGHQWAHQLCMPVPETTFADGAFSEHSRLQR